MLIAYNKNERGRKYIGDKGKLRENWKLRQILEMLLKNKSLLQVQERPVILQWIEEGTEMTMSTSHPPSTSSHTIT